MLMGGNSHGEGNITICGEFNFHADPEAAKVVIDRMECPVVIAPWETCKNTNITWVKDNFYQYIFKSFIFPFILTLCNIQSFDKEILFYRIGEKTF